MSFEILSREVMKLFRRFKRPNPISPRNTAFLCKCIRVRELGRINSLDILSGTSALGIFSLTLSDSR